MYMYIPYPRFRRNRGSRIEENVFENDTSDTSISPSGIFAYHLRKLLTNPFLRVKYLYQYDNMR